VSYQLVLKAATFAADGHRRQRRKDEDASPYINHPLTVAFLVADVGGISDPEVLAAALLHDVIEDVPKNEDERKALVEEVRSAFGETILRYVLEVTDDKSLEKMERKQHQVAHASELSTGAVAIKLGDKIANVTDVTTNPPADWNLEQRKEYLDWAEAVVDNCPKTNAALESRFREVLAKGRRVLLG
jgi:GTP diphosphokinase / guanosine-3',5'-bis(diphosphate) 3'-diphosphatase